MKKLFFLLAVVVATAVSAMAQSRTVNGVVIDAANDDPLIGATVQPVGGGSGVATDLDGRFTLTIPSSVKQVKVSYVGYAEKTVAVSDHMVISLSASDNSLDEIVVTGYGSGKKLGQLVGAVSVVNQAALEDTPTTNVLDALQGQVSGLAINTNSGEPTATSSARIRGVSSLTADTDPLYILDGAPVTASTFATLSANDIASITVLKDAASTAIYGSRAANGVIVVTTKKGKYGEAAKVSIRANVGWSSRVSDKIKMMNSQQYKQYREMLGVPLGEEALKAIDEYGIDTNWQDEVFSNNALTYTLESSITGGGEKSRYFLSLGHTDQDGLIASSGMNRTALRGSFDIDVKDWLKVGLSTNLSYTKYQNNYVASYSGYFYINNPVFQAYFTLPYDSPNYYTIGDNGKPVYGATAEWYRFTSSPNYSWIMSNIQQTNKASTDVNSTLYEQITPIRGLNIKAQQSVSAFDYRGHSNYYGYENYVTPMGDTTNFSSSILNRQRSESFQRRYQFTYTNTAEYTTTLSDIHHLNALLGQESIIYRNHSFGVATSGQPSSEQMLLGQGTTVTMSGISESISEYVMNSYFFNVAYDYDSRYFLTGSYRRDGSSRFAPGHRWANFFSVGAMWNAKNEAFLQPYTWLDDLRLRINYGTTGNSGIGNYEYLGTVGVASYTYNGQSGIGLSSASNPNLTWETVRTFDLGVNFGFSKIVSGSIDFYNKDTKNMLMDVPWSATTGWTEGTANLGSLRNRGVDIELQFNIFQNKDWYVGFRTNFAYNQNTVTELFNGLDKYELTSYGMTYEIGQNPYQLATVTYAGVDPRDGKQLWVDNDGNLTKTYSSSYKRNTGKSFVAPYNGGFGLDLRWKSISLRSDWAWAAKKYIFNWINQGIMNNEYATTYNQRVEMLNTWTTPGQITDIPAYGEEIQADSRYLENSSYLRMKNLTVQYELPRNLMKKLYLDGVKFHFTGRNLLTFTDSSFTGQDPEYENNGVRLSYPNTRQYEFGVEVTF